MDVSLRAVPLASPSRPAFPEARWTPGLRVLALLLLLVGAALRVRFWLADRSLWADEAMLALGLSGKDWRAFLEPLPYDQVAPPGFLLLVRGCESLWGSSERVLRGVSLVAGLLSLPLLLHVASRVLRPVGALVALAAFAVLEPHVRFSAELKPYALDVLVALATTAVALRGRSKPPGALGTGVVAILAAVACWLSFPAVFVVGGAALAGLFSGLVRRDRVRVGRAVVVGAAAAASFAGLYFVVLRPASDSAYLGHFWRLHRAPWPTDGAAARWYAEALFAPFHDPVGFVQAGLGLAAALVGAWGLWSRHRRHALAVLVLPVLATLAGSRVGGYPFAERLLLFLVPSLLLLVGEGVDVAWRAPGARAWGVVTLLLLLGQPAWASASGALRPRGREEIRPLLARLAPRVAPGDVVYVYGIARPQVEWYGARGQGLPSDAKVVFGRWSEREGPDFGADATPLAGTPRAWLLFTHVITWKGADEERLVRAAFDKVGKAVATEPELRETGASAVLYDLTER